MAHSCFLFGQDRPKSCYSLPRVSDTSVHHTIIKATNKVQCQKAGKNTAIAGVLVPKEAEVVKKNLHLIPGIRVTWVCPNQPTLFFGTQKLHCRSCCIELQLPLRLGLGSKRVYADVSVPCLSTTEKALETKGEKLCFPPEQHVGLPYIDKPSQGLQHVHFNSMGGDFRSVLSPRKGLQLEKSV